MCLDKDFMYTMDIHVCVVVMESLLNFCQNDVNVAPVVLVSSNLLSKHGFIVGFISIHVHIVLPGSTC